MIIIIYIIYGTTFMFEPGQSWKTAALRISKCVCLFFAKKRGDKMDEKYMELALLQAKKAYKRKEVPVGCIIVLNNKIIAKAYNYVEKKNSTLEHAELIAIKKAQKKINNWRLNDCTIYVTLEPCLMCLNAIAQSRIKKIVYGTKSTYLTKEERKIEEYICQKNKIEIINNIKETESLNLIKNFFQQRRKHK